MPIDHSVWFRRVAALLLEAALVVVGGTTLASGSTSGPQSLVVTPAIGGLTTIVQLHLIADVWDDQYGGDVVSVKGPSGTACVGQVVGAENVVGDPYQGIQGPNRDKSGPATVYIGPRVDSRYPWEPNAYPPTVGAHDAPLARWCPGQYTGEIWGSDPYATTPKATFQFDISATTRVRPPPSPRAARHPRRVTISPRRGERGAIFAVRYRADANLYARGDVLEVDGPKHSTCRGNVAGGTVGLPNTRSGLVTLHIGPGVERNSRWYQQRYAYQPVTDSGNGVQLRYWCPGTYKATILYENRTKFTIMARFDLYVAR